MADRTTERLNGTFSALFFEGVMRRAKAGPSERNGGSYGPDTDRRKATMAKAGCEVYDVAELKLRWGVDKGTVAKKLKDPMFPAPIARGRWLKYLVHEWEVLRFRRISAHSESSGEIASGPDDLRL